MSKVCLNCGEVIEDEQARFCPVCGASIEPNSAADKSNSGLLLAAWILMIIETVATAVLIIPLAWKIPITIAIRKRMNGGPRLSVGFKVCTLIFGDIISGILLLCDSEI